MARATDAPLSPSIFPIAFVLTVTTGVFSSDVKRLPEWIFECQENKTAELKEEIEKDSLSLEKDIKDMEKTLKDFVKCIVAHENRDVCLHDFKVPAVNEVIQKKYKDGVRSLQLRMSEKIVNKSAERIEKLEDLRRNLTNITFRHNCLINESRRRESELATRLKDVEKMLDERKKEDIGILQERPKPTVGGDGKQRELCTSMADYEKSREKVSSLELKIAEQDKLIKELQSNVKHLTEIEAKQRDSLLRAEKAIAQEKNNSLLLQECLKKSKLTEAPENRMKFEQKITHSLQETNHEFNSLSVQRTTSSQEAASMKGVLPELELWSVEKTTRAKEKSREKISSQELKIAAKSRLIEELQTNIKRLTETVVRQRNSLLRDEENVTQAKIDKRLLADCLENNHLKISPEYKTTPIRKRKAVQETRDSSNLISLQLEIESRNRRIEQLQSNITRLNETIENRKKHILYNETDLVSTDVDKLSLNLCLTKNKLKMTPDYKIIPVQEVEHVLNKKAAQATNKEQEMRLKVEVKERILQELLSNLTSLMEIEDKQKKFIANVDKTINESKIISSALQECLRMGKLTKPQEQKSSSAQKTTSDSKSTTKQESTFDLTFTPVQEIAYDPISTAEQDHEVSNETFSLRLQMAEKDKRIEQLQSKIKRVTETVARQKDYILKNEAAHESLSVDKWTLNFCLRKNKLNMTQNYKIVPMQETTYKQSKKALRETDREQEINLEIAEKDKFIHDLELDLKHLAEVELEQEITYANVVKAINESDSISSALQECLRIDKLTKPPDRKSSSARRTVSDSIYTTMRERTYYLTNTPLRKIKSDRTSTPGHKTTTEQSYEESREIISLRLETAEKDARIDQLRSSIERVNETIVKQKNYISKNEAAYGSLSMDKWELNFCLMKNELNMTPDYKIVPMQKHPHVRDKKTARETNKEQEMKLNIAKKERILQELIFNLTSLTETEEKQKKSIANVEKTIDESKMILSAIRECLRIDKLPKTPDQTSSSVHETTLDSIFTQTQETTSYPVGVPTQETTMDPTIDSIVYEITMDPTVDPIVKEITSYHKTSSLQEIPPALEMAPMRDAAPKSVNIPELQFSPTPKTTMQEVTQDSGKFGETNPSLESKILEQDKFIEELQNDIKRLTDVVGKQNNSLAYNEKTIKESKMTSMMLRDCLQNTRTETPERETTGTTVTNVPTQLPPRTHFYHLESTYCTRDGQAFTYQPGNPQPDERVKRMRELWLSRVKPLYLDVPHDPAKHQSTTLWARVHSNNDRFYDLITVPR